MEFLIAIIALFISSLLIDIKKILDDIYRDLKNKEGF